MTWQAPASSNSAAVAREVEVFGVPVGVAVAVAVAALAPLPVGAARGQQAAERDRPECRERLTAIHLSCSHAPRLPRAPVNGLRVAFSREALPW